MGQRPDEEKREKLLEYLEQQKLSGNKVNRAEAARISGYSESYLPDLFVRLAKKNVNQITRPKSEEDLIKLKQSSDDEIRKDLNFWLGIVPNNKRSAINLVVRSFWQKRKN